MMENRPARATACSSDGSRPRQRRTARAPGARTRPRERGRAARPPAARSRRAGAAAQDRSTQRLHEREQRVHEAAAERHARCGRAARAARRARARRTPSATPNATLALRGAGGGGAQLGELLLAPARSSTVRSRSDAVSACRTSSSRRCCARPRAPPRAGPQLDRADAGSGGWRPARGSAARLGRRHEPPALADDLRRGARRHGHGLAGQQPRAVLAADELARRGRARRARSRPSGGGRRPARRSAGARARAARRCRRARRGPSARRDARTAPAGGGRHG